MYKKKAGGQGRCIGDMRVRAKRDSKAGGLSLRFEFVFIVRDILV
jgi:hypothetical protein